MNKIWYIHNLIILFIFLIPIYPIEILKYTFFIPIFLPLLWLIYGDCPLSKYYKNDDFIFDAIRFILNKIKLKKNTIEPRVVYVFYFFLMLIFFISTLRLFNHYCTNSINFF